MQPDPRFTAGLRILAQWVIELLVEHANGHPSDEIIAQPEPQRENTPCSAPNLSQI